ncbi:hypothetical protein ACLOJK_007272 [Asimina triloba]
MEILKFLTNSWKGNAYLLRDARPPARGMGRIVGVDGGQQLQEDEKEDEAESEELGNRPGGKRRGVGGARLLEDEVFVELTRRGPLAPLALPAPCALLKSFLLVLGGDVDFGEPPARQRELEGDDFLQDRDSFKETTERLVEAKKERLKEATTANAKERRRTDSHFRPRLRTVGFHFLSSPPSVLAGASGERPHVRLDDVMALTR